MIEFPDWKVNSKKGNCILADFNQKNVLELITAECAEKNRYICEVREAFSAFRR